MPFHEEIKWREIPDDLFTFPNESNFIFNLITHPCARPWYVWVQTFVPAFLKLLATVAFFDVEDAIRAHGEMIVRDRRGGKRKRHGTKVKVTGGGRKVDRWAQQGLKTLLVVTSPLEKIGFVWLLYSAVDRFFLDWQTLLDRSDFCKSPIESGPLQVSRGQGFISVVVGFVPIIMVSVRQNRSGWGVTALGADLPEGVFQSALGLSVIGPPGGVVNLKIRIRSPGAFGDDITESDPLTLRSGEEGSMTVQHSFWYPIIGGGTVTWEIGGETIPAGIEATKGHFFCQRSG